MTKTAQLHGEPQWWLTRWLAGTGQSVPDDVRARLQAMLFGNLPIFLGGAASTTGVAVLVALFFPSPAILAWCAVEIAINLARLAVMVHAHGAMARGRAPLIDLNILLAVAWGFSTGLGAGLSLISGNWAVAIVVCISAAGMVGGMCFRYVCAPRLASAVIGGALIPATIGALASGNPILLISAVQAPALLVAMTMAAFQLHRTLLASMMAEREHRHRSRHDPLTGLPNRLGILGDAERRIAAAGPDRPLALLYLDLDGFKLVNDGHGHMAGDQVLTAVAARLQQALAADEAIGRIGGDEFVVLAGGDRLAAEKAAERIAAALAPPYPLPSGAIARIGVSIGIALLPEDGTDIDTRLGRADLALYAAKAGGKARHAFACALPVADAPELAPNAAE
ncbi:GGDEF domain-containing protein [Phreatobacter sp.]|uniref:GGDEF domain-containing protein n=1 Tax=Phreatobacter sp. TaxID=1966341 RepID=UPI0022CB2E70|nr:GGDEF domain-containing protein [Phreatobacter sp.]MCZ8315565.1 GGDEF domain-containing protein [Phreatobacter sp.]